MKKILGYAETTKEIDFAGFQNRIHPKVRNKVKETISNYFKGVTLSYHNEYRIYTAPNNYSWIVSEGTIIARKEQGQATQFIGTLKNITEKKLANRTAKPKKMESLLKAVAKNYFAKQFVVPTFFKVIDNWITDSTIIKNDTKINLKKLPWLIQN